MLGRLSGVEAFCLVCLRTWVSVSVYQLLTMFLTLSAPCYHTFSLLPLSIQEVL